MGDLFGSSIVLASNGSTALVVGKGASKVYVYDLSNFTCTTITESATLPLASGTHVNPLALSADGKTAAIGDATRNNSQGTVYIFARPATGWSGLTSYTAQISASDGQGCITNPLFIFRLQIGLVARWP